MPRSDDRKYGRGGYHHDPPPGGGPPYEGHRSLVDATTRLYLAIKLAELGFHVQGTVSASGKLVINFQSNGPPYKGDPPDYQWYTNADGSAPPGPEGTGRYRTNPY